MATKKAKTLTFLNTFFLLLLFEGPFISFFKDKKKVKKSQNNGNQGFLTIFA
jgi:hypothetical protein